MSHQPLQFKERKHTKSHYSKSLKFHCRSQRHCAEVAVCDRGGTPIDLGGDPIPIGEPVEGFDRDIIDPGDIVAIGIHTGNCLPCYRVLKEANSKGARVIMGSVHSTISPDEPLEMGSDSVVTGNGEMY